MQYTRLTPALRLATALMLAAALSACGGGGGSSGGSGGGSGGGGSGGSSDWTFGVFKAASTFKDRCETPRTGVDMAGVAFTDKAGTATSEKNWLRSWTHETYLWNTEVPDTNPAGSATRLQYFDALKTSAITSSGKAKDDFHFSELTSDYLARVLSAASASYGAEFVIVSSTVPREVRVAYTDPGTPASAVDSGVPKLIRGTEILAVNGVDLVNGGFTQAEIDTLNNGLFPPNAGVTNTFVVRDPGASSTRTITLTAQNLTSKPVNRTSVITEPSGSKTGYILFTTFSPYESEKEIVAAMQSMKDAGVSDLVLDLRYNGGGLLAVASELSYMIAGDSRTAGKTFERLRFNASAGTRNPVTGETNAPVPFFNTAVGFSLTSGTALPTLNLSRVTILATESTCSASEAVINGLRGVGVEVVLIGGGTCGKPYGFYPEDNCGITYYTIQFQGVNELGFGDYANGFAPMNASSAFPVKLPGCAVSDDYSRELGDAGEGLLNAALGYKSTGVCPTPPITARRGPDGVTATSTAALSRGLPLEAPERPLMTVNRDMSMPRQR